MAKGNEIVVSSNPKGVFLEGFISGTPKPGTIVQIKAATEPIGGEHTWEVYAPPDNADGYRTRGPLAVLLPDRLRGKLSTDAYATGDRCFLYVPAPGETLNVLVANIAGTGDAFAIGDLLIPQDNTGKMIATAGTVEMEPFTVLETVAALTADTLIWCMFNGY